VIEQSGNWLRAAGQKPEPQGQRCFIRGWQKHQPSNEAQCMKDFFNPSEAGAWALGKNINREDPPVVGGCHGRGRLSGVPAWWLAARRHQDS
jgi:hypothetical protein